MGSEIQEKKGKHIFYALGDPDCMTIVAIIEWKLTRDGRLSIVGQCGGSGGQCQDTIRENAHRIQDNDEQLLCLRMLDVWDRWHLNDMRAGCEHQRHWSKERIPIAELKNKRVNQDKDGAYAIWVREEEHPKGLLCKPCPTCGYKYGTAWLKENLPASLIYEIVHWPSNTEVK